MRKLVFWEKVLQSQAMEGEFVFVFSKSGERKLGIVATHVAVGAIFYRNRRSLMNKAQTI